MSILIKGVGIPSKCIECRLMRRCGKDDLDYVCMPARVYVEDLTNAYKPRPDYCPLVPVPEHGDLIDRDALMKGEGRYIISFGKEGIDVAEIYRAPTIIPADDPKEE